MAGSKLSGNVVTTTKIHLIWRLAELQDYLGCGLLQRGFALVACKGCQERHLVAFSCRSPSFCPSCVGRRMAATTLNLLAHVVPAVGLRQFA